MKLTIVLEPQEERGFYHKSLYVHRILKILICIWQAKTTLKEHAILKRLEMGILGLWEKIENQIFKKQMLG